MFHHKSKNCIIPQRFHARFSGQIASFWGNSSFLLPTGISKDNFILGISEHDRGYDEFDTVDFLNFQSQEERFIARKKFYENAILRKSVDTFADNIVLTHTKFMCDDFPVYQKNIDIIIKGQNDSQFDYDKLRSITYLVDNIAFDASKGENSTKTIGVENYINGIVPIKYNIIDNHINVNPRPFSIDTFDIMLFGCRKEMYPSEINIHGILYTFSK